MNSAPMILKALTTLAGTLGLLAACGDTGTSNTGGSPGSGGSPAAGGAGGEAPAECDSAATPAPYWCECAAAVNALSTCTSDECDGQTACDEACADDGGVASFEVADYLPGADCDTVCNNVCNCPNSSRCDVYFWCDILPGQAKAEAEAVLACIASSGGNWSCNADGLPTYDGPTTCN
jgi:hypothetical protein